MKQNYKVILPEIIMALCVCSLADVRQLLTITFITPRRSNQNIQYSPMDVMMTVDKFDAYMEKVRKVRETIIADPLGSFISAL